MATKYLRGKTWWARAQRKGREFRESLKTRNARVAEKRLGEWVERLDAIGWGDRARVSFKEAMKQYMTDHLRNLKPKAAMRYEVSLAWLNDKIGELSMDEIKRETLADFESWRRNMKVSSGTIRRDLSCLSSLFAFCEDREWLEDGHNPVPAYLRRRARRGLKEAPGRTRYLSEAEEFDVLFHATETVREAIMLSIDTGLREQEVFSLTWPQVDLRQGVITTTTDTKSGKSRTVPFTKRSAQFLAQWKKDRANSADGKVAYPYVFRHDDTGKRYVNMNKGFKAACRRAKVTGVRWHDLRRTAGCRWRQREGLPLEKVSILLGHSSYAVTEKSYAFLQNEKIAVDMAAQKPAQGTADSARKA